ncbi:MAG: metallophosphoesterase [Micromonosporaceae bacterium]|nr:metallophosphoesterase [Micromonosporaceae bacterium]
MRLRTAFRVVAGVAAAGAATLAYASLVERNLFTLRRFDVPLLDLDDEPLRILHLSDLHLMPNQRRKAQWVADLAGLDPDLVVVTGDNWSHPEALPIVSQAFEPLLTYPGAFVFGSNDYKGPVFKNPFSYFDKDREYIQGVDLPYESLRSLFVSAGWADLNNARTTIKAGGRTVELVGVDDPHVDRDSYESVAGAASPSADLHIGVVHTPDPSVLDAMAADGFTLLLAGHTHGGQVCVPGVGALVTNCGLPRQMAKGLHRWPSSSSWLHVSAGLGTHPTAPVRFACRPEASLLTLVPR